MPALPSMAFTNALPPQRDLQWQIDATDGSARLVRFLKQQDRLPGVRFVDDAALSRWRIGEEASEKWAHWELAAHADGSLEMSGAAASRANWSRCRTLS